MPIMGVKCKVIKHAGYDLYGKKLRGREVTERCGVVRLEVLQQDSTVRVDSGATRGAADELRSEVVILMSKSSTVEMDDLVEIGGRIKTLIKVTSIRARYSVMGALDHLQVGGQIEQ